MARPPLAILWAFQQTIDNLLVGLWRVVSQICGQLFARRRQPDQIHIHPPQQRRLIRLFHRHESLRFMPSSDKGIDWIAGPRGAANLRNLWPDHGMIRPVIARVGQGSFHGRMRALVNPLLK